MAPAQALRQADAAVVGELIKVVPRGSGRATFRYRVHGVYKSRRSIEAGRVISVQGTTQSAACGLPQATGKRYGLLLAEDDEGNLFGGLCGLIEPRRLRFVAGQSASSPRRSGADEGDCTT